jgi:hypothetical protein
MDDALPRFPPRRFQEMSSSHGALMVVVIVVALIAIPATVVEVLEFLEGPGI